MEKTDNRKSKTIARTLARDYKPEQIDQKVSDYDKYALKLDNFVSKQEQQTESLIKRIKTWDSDLQKIYQAYEDNSEYHRDLGKHMKERKKNIHIGRKIVQRE